MTSVSTQRHKCATAVWPRLTGLALLLIAAMPALPVTVERYTIEETVHDAGAIVVGTFISHQSRWGDSSHRWMMTDYTFQVQDVILPGGNAAPGQNLTLSFWGGTIGDETQFIAGFHPPDDGVSYVLMLRADWQSSGFTPAVAFNNGLFPVAGDPSAGTATVLDADGQPLDLVDNRIERFNPDAQDNGQPGVALSDFLDYLRANLTLMKASAGHPAPQIDAFAMPVFAKQPLVGGNAGGASGGEVPAQPEPTAISAPAKPQKPVVQMVDVSSQAMPEPEWVRFSMWRSTPVAVNSFQDTFPHPWFPEDQYQMSKWNYYADIYRVRNPRTGTYSWGDGINDLAGWPSDADLRRVYGSGWDAGTLAVTFSRKDGSGYLLEADIALNPAYGWTVDDAADYLDTTTAWPYRRTMLHEMGHMWGADHNFNFISIMNYPPKVFRSYCIPFMDDAEGVRATYSGNLQGRTDLGAYMFTSVGYQNWSASGIPGSVVAGNSFTLQNIHVENVGTATINSPTLEFYLTTALDYNHPYFYLQTLSYSPPLPRFNYYNPITASFTVPAYVDGGDYYVADYIRNDDGAEVGSFPYNNNFGFTRTTLRVIPRLTGVSVNPDHVSGGTSSVGRVTLGGNAGPGGLSVSLSSDNPSVASVPDTVFIPAGSNTNTFPITTYVDPTTTGVSITASSSGINQSATITVTAGSAIAVDDQEDFPGNPITFAAYLSRGYNDAGVGGKTLNFYVDTLGLVGSAVTDDTGTATLDWTIPDDMVPDSYAITVTFDGDNSYEPASGTGTLTVDDPSQQKSGMRRAIRKPRLRRVTRRK